MGRKMTAALTIEALVLTSNGSHAEATSLAFPKYTSTIVNTGRYISRKYTLRNLPKTKFTNACPY